jgi:hypothetical protein
MRNRYPNTPNLGSAKIPSVLYYDHKGNFRGIESGLDLQDDDAFLKIRWWETAIRSRVQDTDGALGGSC